MEFLTTPLNDVILIRPKVNFDQRGFVLETYRKEEFLKAGITAEFVQDNHSGSSRGVLRGLHYQIKNTQGKLVRVLQGEIFDVAVDLRRNSTTFGKWYGCYLSSENNYQLWLSEGFAHGFLVTTDWAEVAYKTTDYYAPEWERSLLWNDPDLKIKWRFLIENPPIMSSKDLQGKPLVESEVFE